LRTLQALVTELFNGHIELDVEQDRLRSANKAEAKPIGAGWLGGWT
jgi:hypothetical protein